MPDGPDVVVFDVNETLSDMSPLAGRFVEIGLAATDVEPWFAGVLRDGFALAAVGESRRFRDIAASNLAAVGRAGGRSGSLSSSDIGHVLSGFAALEVHADVAPAMGSLATAGYRLVTLTNGAVAMSEGLLDRAGVLRVLEHRLSVEDAGFWKPRPEPYLYTARICGVSPARMALVAVHPWDVHGAQRAGLRGVWVNRGSGVYPSYLPAPDRVVEDLRDLGTALEGMR